ncbi:unnamed protein product [Paramecium octaurelia]|uniref:Uncharacterized protein n=1 Tax=Paramecium octaurelia TaxID=43137 RepID=A0A8S1W504_PAROT|nr:unnamed protein product [Paramecium octaurelia]
MDKVDKCWLLEPHNDNLYINCNLDLNMKNRMGNNLVKRHNNFQVKPIPNQYLRMQIQLNQKLYFLLNLVQSSKFQLQKDYRRKIQLTMYKQQGMCKYMNTKMILFQVKNFQKTMYPENINRYLSNRHSCIYRSIYFEQMDDLDLELYSQQEELHK